jgi:hypothetical protein
MSSRLLPLLLLLLRDDVWVRTQVQASQQRKRLSLSGRSRRLDFSGHSDPGPTLFLLGPAPLHRSLHVQKVLLQLLQSLILLLLLLSCVWVVVLPPP